MSVVPAGGGSDGPDCVARYDVTWDVVRSGDWAMWLRVRFAVCTGRAGEKAVIWNFDVVEIGEGATPYDASKGGRVGVIEAEMKC